MQIMPTPIRCWSFALHYLKPGIMRGSPKQKFRRSLHCLAKSSFCDWLAAPVFVLLLKIMKISEFAIFIIMGTIVLLAGDYQIKSVKILPVESYPARTELGGVTIAVDPYPSDEKSYLAFDVKNLNSRGYYPVHLIIRNSSPSFLTIRTRNVVLITSAGQQLYTTPATVLVEDVIKSKPSAKAGSPLSDFTGKELTNRTVDPGKVEDGFLFFFIPTPKKDFFVGSTLYIPKLEEEGTRRPLGPFAIPLNPALGK
jgi:hypothetical protein